MLKFTPATWLWSAGPRNGDMHLFLDTQGTCPPTSIQQKYLISIYWKPAAPDKVLGPGDTFLIKHIKREKEKRHLPNLKSGSVLTYKEDHWDIGFNVIFK